MSDSPQLCSFDDLQCDEMEDVREVFFFDKANCPGPYLGYDLGYVDAAIASDVYRFCPLTLTPHYRTVANLMLHGY